jgi:hypothetical protein
MAITIYNNPGRLIPIEHYRDRHWYRPDFVARFGIISSQEYLF